MHSPSRRGQQVTVLVAQRFGVALQRARSRRKETLVLPIADALRRESAFVLQG